ncbi:MAG: hypothetical protein GY925_04530, partial [Actinomycetia bacterium]|nr:hypothetical protein [Actinomycetes bacterium]
DPPPAAPLTPQRLTETLGIAPADLASVETCEALAARARRLPSDLLAAVNTAVVRDGLPNLKSGRVTGEHADQIDAILELADTAHNTRTVRALETMSALGSDLMVAVAVAAGIDPARPHTDWTGDETDTYVAIAEWCAGDGPYTLTYTPGGQAIIGADPDPALDRLVELFGGKRALLAAAKQVNTDRRLRMQVGSSADVAANLTLTALTATRLTEQADQ